MSIKRIFNLLLTLLIVGGLSFACSGNEEQPKPNEKPQEEEPKDPDDPSNPDDPKDPEDEPQTITFQAAAAQREGLAAQWAAEDEIAIWWSADGRVVAKASEAGENTEFELDEIEEAEAYYAIYPATGVESFADGVFSLSVPSVQNGALSDVDIWLASTSAEDKSLAFKPATALVKLEVESSEYDRVVFRAANGEALAGTVSVSFGEEGLVFGEEVADPAESIQMAIPGPGVYYLSVLPGTLEKGVFASFYKGEKAAPMVYLEGATKADPAVLASAGKLDKMIVYDYYVSEAGSGNKDGRSEANAMSLDSLRAFVAQPLDGEGNQIDELAHLMAAILDGTTVHFADGTYVLNVNGSEHPAKIEFTGYPKQVDLTFEGSNAAILSGGNEYRVLTLGNQINLTLNGMAVKDGNLESFISDEGAGISVAAGGSGNATLNANGTLFSNNRCLENNSENKGNSGGAIRCAKGTVNLVNCVFDETNHARNGGSVFTNNDAAVVNCTGCTFKSYSYNTGGAANNSKGKQYFTNCTFDGCYTYSGCGGALHANAANCVVVVDGCTFHACKARTKDASSSNKESGIISVQTADFTINNSVFENCEGIAGALIFLQGSDNLFKCNNTVFKNNTGSDRGLIKGNGSGANDIASVGFFNNCVFYNNKMKTNQWGNILHGGNPAVACFNNCTFYGNTREQAGGNGVGLNTDGSIILLNSTFIEADDLVSVRAATNDGDGRNCVLLANSIVLNTSSGKPFIASDKLKPAKSSSYNCIMGSVYTAPENYSSHNDVMDATEASLEGGSYNATSNLYLWNGPDGSFTKMASSDFEEILKTGAGVRPTKKTHPYLGTKTIGEAFYEWLVSIDAIGKDAAGNSRGSLWWPGAYQY
ncbi:MAG: right-handed parallel beta-helix repeat-containing protein [Bacteroidales bacterium]|nr:right-handed parallel beta-helix repeat-containing protein [Bacteroidales bacterium]